MTLHRATSTMLKWITVNKTTNLMINLKRVKCLNTKHKNNYTSLTRLKLKTKKHRIKIMDLSNNSKHICKATHKMNRHMDSIKILVVIT